MGGCCSKWDPGKQEEKKSLGGDTPKLHKLEHKESFAGQKVEGKLVENGHFEVQSQPMAATPINSKEKNLNEDITTNEANLEETTPLKSSFDDDKVAIAESKLSPNKVSEIIDPMGTSMTTSHSKGEESPTSAVSSVSQKEISEGMKTITQNSVFDKEVREEVSTKTSVDVQNSSVIQSSISQRVEAKTENKVNEIKSSSVQETSEKQEISSAIQSSMLMEGSGDLPKEFLDLEKAGSTFGTDMVPEHFNEVSKSMKTVSSVQESSVTQHSSSVKESTSSQISHNSEAMIESSVSKSSNEMSQEMMSSASESFSRNSQHESSVIQSFSENKSTIVENSSQEVSEAVTFSRNESNVEKSSVVESSVTNTLQSQSNNTEVHESTINSIQLNEVSNASLSSKEQIVNEQSSDEQQSSLLKNMSDIISNKTSLNDPDSLTSVSNFSTKKMSSSSSSSQSSSVKTSVSRSGDKEPVVSSITEETSSKTESAAESEATMVNGEVVSSLDQAERSHEEKSSLTLKDKDTEEHSSVSLSEQEGMKAVNNVVQEHFQNSSIDENKTVTSIAQAETQGEPVMNENANHESDDVTDEPPSLLKALVDTSVNIDIDDNLPPPPLDIVSPSDLEVVITKSEDVDIPLPPELQNNYISKLNENSTEEQQSGLLKSMSGILSNKATLDDPESNPDNTEEVDTAAVSPSSYVDLISPTGFVAGREETEVNRKMFTNSLLNDEKTDTIGEIGEVIITTEIKESEKE